MKIVIFGTGIIYRRYKEVLLKENIVCFLDNDESKKDKLIDGIPCYLPEEISKFEYDYVFILSSYVDDMYAQLLSLGVSKEKIKFQHDLFSFCYRKGMYKEQCKKKALMIFHEYSLSGAAFCFYEVCKLLIKEGYGVTTICIKSGPLIPQLEDCGADVVIDPLLNAKTLKDYEDGEGYELAFVNTIIPYHLLVNRDYKIPTLWWLHEPMMLYKNVKFEIANKVLQDNLFVYAVSDIATQGVKKFFPQLEVQLMHYGVKTVRKEDRKRIICIGNCEVLKGQDVLIKAIERLPQNVKEHVEVFVIGRCEGEFFKEWSAYIKEHKLPIYFLGMLENEAVKRILNGSDLLISTSRQDSLPVSIVEAMQLEVPVITSDGTGMAEYIHKFKAGYVFSNEDDIQLSQMIKTVLFEENNTEVIKRALEMVNNDFTIEKFEQNIKEKLKIMGI